MNPEPPNFLAKLTGCFATPVAGNPTVAMVEAAFQHHGLNWRYINCEVLPERLADAVRGAKAMGWVGFNCSIPHKIAVIEHLDGLGDSAKIIGAVNTVVLRGDKYIGENTDGRGFVHAMQGIIDPSGKMVSFLAPAERPGLSPWKWRWRALHTSASSTAARSVAKNWPASEGQNAGNGGGFSVDGAIPCARRSRHRH